MKDIWGEVDLEHAIDETRRPCAQILSFGFACIGADVAATKKTWPPIGSSTSHECNVHTSTFCISLPVRRTEILVIIGVSTQFVKP